MPRHDLAWALAPVTPAAFFAEHHERGRLHVARRRPDYFDGLVTLGDLDTVLTGMGLSVPEIAVAWAGHQIGDADYTYPSGFVDPVRASALHARGATLIFSNLQERLPRLAAFARAVEAAVSTRVQTNVYLTPGDTQGFGTHWDTHDVLVLQVSGVKLWRFYDSPVALPLPEQGFQPGADFGPPVAELHLAAGDTLYVPRGMVHDAVATGETSLHVTTGLMTPRWSDLLIAAVGRAAEADVALRRALPPDHAAQDFDPEAARRLYRDLVARLADVDPAELLADIAATFRANRVPRVPGQLLAATAAPDLRDAEVGPRPDLVWHLEDTGDGIALEVHGSCITLPAHAGAALRCLLSGPARLADLPGPLDDAGRETLVRRLIREGVLVVRVPSDSAPDTA